MIRRLLAVSAVLLGMLIPSAAGMTEPTYNATIEPAPARIQKNSDKICHWLQNTGHPLPVCPTAWQIEPDEAKDKYQVKFAPNAIALRVGVVWDKALLQYRDLPGNLRGDPYSDEVYVSIHELVHWFNVNELPGGSYVYTQDMLWWEEGIADAYTNDIIRSVWSQIWGVRWYGDYVIYPKRTRSIRAVSARATGGSWKARPARIWRREFAKAGWPTRQAMLAVVGINLTLTPSPAS